jgi:hypothetical protein
MSFQGPPSGVMQFSKEMKNLMPAFEIINDDKQLIGYKKIPYRMIFDIKLDRTCKARLVAGGHVTYVPKESVYASVVSRDSMRLAFMLASLNDLKVLVGDVHLVWTQ